MKEHEFLELCKGMNAIKGTGRIVAGFFILESDDTPNTNAPTPEQLNEIHKNVKVINKQVLQMCNLVNELMELRKQREQEQGEPSQPDTEEK
jgi:hypothetical protein